MNGLACTLGDTRTNLAALTIVSLARCPSYCFRSLSSVNNWRTAALGVSVFKGFTSRYLVYCVTSDQISRHGVLLLYCMGLWCIFSTSLSITWVHCWLPTSLLFPLMESRTALHEEGFTRCIVTEDMYIFRQDSGRQWIISGSV
jgi:hypothetical protein